ncbi:MAG: hypothetical protein WD002_00510, partial [Pseudomonadales bacterium]
EAMERDTDVIAYERLYKALGEPDDSVRLPTSFAYNVMSRILEIRLASRDPAATLVSMLVSLIALAGSVCALLVLSATGYNTIITWTAIEQILGRIPAGAGYVALCLVMLAISDIVINHKRPHRV